MMDDLEFDEYIVELDQLLEESPSLLYTEALSAEMKSDFRIFMHFVWKEGFGFKPHPIQYRFAHLLQQAKDPTILMAFREFGKTIMDATLTAWDKYCDPNHTTLVVSAAQPRAMEIVGMALQVIKSCAFLSHLVPGNDDRKGTMAFTTSGRTRVVKEASAVATSITSGNTGAHADRILSDDIEIPKNSDTQDKRAKIMVGLDEYTYILNGDGVEIYIGTPQTEESVYFKLANENGYTLYRVPCEYPDPADEIAMSNLAPFLLDDLRAGRAEPGDPTYPQRFDVEALAKQRAKSPSSYALQMLLDPSASDENKYPLKLRDFIVMDLDPSWGPKRVMWNTATPLNDIPSVGMGRDQFYGPAFVDWTPTKYEHCIMGIDPAGSGDDEVGYCVGKKILGNVYITDAGGIQGGHDDATLKKLCKIMVEQDVKEVRIEKNFADGLYGQNLARVMGQMGLKIPVEQVHSKGQKELRILQTLEPAMAAHKVVLHTKVARDQVLMSQITRLTKLRGALSHDDRVDAMEICLSGFKDAFSVDTDKMIEEVKDDEFQTEIQGYLKGNAKPKQKSYVSGFLTGSRGQRPPSRRGNVW